MAVLPAKYFALTPDDPADPCTTTVSGAFPSFWIRIVNVAECPGEIFAMSV